MTYTIFKKRADLNPGGRIADHAYLELADGQGKRYIIDPTLSDNLLAVYGVTNVPKVTQPLNLNPKIISKIKEFESMVAGLKDMEHQVAFTPDQHKRILENLKEWCRIREELKTSLENKLVGEELMKNKKLVKHLLLNNEFKERKVGELFLNYGDRLDKKLVIEFVKNGKLLEAKPMKDLKEQLLNSQFFTGKLIERLKRYSAHRFSRKGKNLKKFFP